MTETLTPDDIKGYRQAMGASVREFDDILGYRGTDGRMTMALESGIRHGKPFVISGPTQTALRYFIAIQKSIKMLERGAPVESVIACLGEIIPGWAK